MKAQAQADSIELVPVQGRARLNRFIRLPETLYRADPNFVPPLQMERRAALTPRGNPFLRRAKAAFWIARRHGKDVGRISAQHDPEIAANDGAGHFGMLAAVDDSTVFAALFAQAESWLARHGRTRAQGPYSLSINEETGLLVDGFDTPPMLMMPHDPPYAAARVEALGYAKTRDLYAYLCDAAAALPPASARVVARGLPTGVALRPMRLHDLGAEIALLADIFNDAWQGNWGFMPITEDEVGHMARVMRPLLHERLVWFAEVGGEPAAFGVCLPNLNAAIHDLSGRLAPIGWAKLLWRLKVSGVETARVPLMGVRRKFADGMLGRLLALHVTEALRREAVAMGIKSVEMSWVLEDNMPMRRLAEAVGGRAYKTYRVYERTFSA